jgi:hypothetical protein
MISFDYEREMELDQCCYFVRSFLRKSDPYRLFIAIRQRAAVTTASSHGRSKKTVQLAVQSILPLRREGRRTGAGKGYRRSGCVPECLHTSKVHDGVKNRPQSMLPSLHPSESRRFHRGQSMLPPRRRRLSSVSKDCGGSCSSAVDGSDSFYIRMAPDNCARRRMVVALPFLILDNQCSPFGRCLSSSAPGRSPRTFNAPLLLAAIFSSRTPHRLRRRHLDPLSILPLPLRW